MGFRVKSYSLSELNRISLPGSVAPCLFWALPVGGWHPAELEEFWRLFTKLPGECNDFGLLLVKEAIRRDGNEGHVSLESVGAKLADLMPTGSERFVRPTAYGGESPKLLVLSGGYPQPGWGILVDWQRGSTRRFQDLIGSVVARLSDGNELDVFRRANDCFHRLRALRAPARNPNVGTLEGELVPGEKVYGLLREAQSALEAGMYLLVGQKLITAFQAFPGAAWLKISEDAFQRLLDTQRRLLSAASVLAVSNEFLRSEIEPNLGVIIADARQKEAAYRRLSDEGGKRALKACIDLRSQGIVPETESFRDWATQIMAETPLKLAVELAGCVADVEGKLLIHRGQKAQLEHEHDFATERWRQSSREAREAFHLAAERAGELQWELGPQFLVAFDQVCREGKLPATSIPWDPARMIGWKIMVSAVRLDSRDLQVAAQELAPGAPAVSFTNGPTIAVADGSYFTDYVHHIAISKPGFSPRAVTRDLLARLLRPAEMIDLIQAQGVESSSVADAQRLAEELLCAMGWQKSDPVPERPLAGCIKVVGNATPVLPANLSGNEIRIVLESFCKDVIDVVVAELGYNHDGIWSAIEERIPTYRPTSMTKDWEEEVRLLTVGGAAMILPALGALAFPTKASEVAQFSGALRDLSNALNKTSHHREGTPASSEALGSAPQLIRDVLAKAEAFLGELPWHMDASFVYGEQPKVLSGEAWSHGSPAPRLLRVIVWAGTAPGVRVTFWNKTRRNPVVTDPVFIARPRRV